MASEMITDNLITALLFLGVVLVITVRIRGWNFVKSLIAGSWYTTQGRVEFGSVEERHVRYFNYYIARLDYSYSVNQEYYSGFLERVFLRESSADRFVAAMKGQPLFVRSHPHRPEKSALLARDQPGGWPA